MPDKLHPDVGAQSFYAKYRFEKLFVEKKMVGSCFIKVSGLESSVIKTNH